MSTSPSQSTENVRKIFREQVKPGAPTITGRYKYEIRHVHHLGDDTKPPRSVSPAERIVHLSESWKATDSWDWKHMAIQAGQKSIQDCVTCQHQKKIDENKSTRVLVDTVGILLESQDALIKCHSRHSRRGPTIQIPFRDMNDASGAYDRFVANDQHFCPTCDSKMHHWELDWRKHYVPLEDVPTVEKNEESFFDDQISSGSQNLIPTESHQSLDPTVLPQPIDGSVDRDLPDSDLEIEIESNASTVPSPSSSGSLRLRIKNSFRKLKEPRVGHKRL